MMPLVTRQSYMALNVEDLDASVRDAENVLGLRVVDYHEGKAVLTATARLGMGLSERDGEGRRLDLALLGIGQVPTQPFEHHGRRHRRAGAAVPHQHVARQRGLPDQLALGHAHRLRLNGVVNQRKCRCGFRATPKTLP